MTIGQRIKDKRLELELSVDLVAAKLNKNRATIYRYESDEIENLPTTVLEPLAEILQTTPAFLMGWEDDTDGYMEKVILISENNYKEPKSPDIRKIARAGDKLNSDQQEQLLKVAQALFPEAFKDDD